MKDVNRAIKYAKNENLLSRWNGLCKWRKRYARYLVCEHGYTAHTAIQRAAIFGYDQYPYDYRLGHVVEETVPKSRFYRA